VTVAQNIATSNWAQMEMERIEEEQESPAKRIDLGLTYQLQKDLKIMNQVCQRLVTASDEYPALYLE
jgi:hypothetical protein